jgi:6-phosphogluconolactonase
VADAVTPAVHVLADAEALAARAADIVAEVIAARPRVGIALAGGTTPRRCYELLAARGLDLGGVHVWYGDERMVPPDHPDSNFGMALRAWLAPAGMPPAQNHRILGELGGDEAARVASAELRGHAGDAPAFELVLLGIGADGHTASLFPGDPALDATGLFAPAKSGARVTATLPLLSAAARVVFLAAGTGKTAAIAQARRGEVPAGLVHAPRVEWLLDADAARGLS